VDDHHLLLLGFDTPGRTKMTNEIKQLFTGNLLALFQCKKLMTV
jgi:hypothetical protein